MGWDFEADLKQRIDEVLHYVWDPIGVAGVPQARDEYSNYVERAFQLLQRNSSDADVARYLDNIATERMGLSSNPEHSLKAAKLMKLWRDLLLKKPPAILG